MLWWSVQLNFLVPHNPIVQSQLKSSGFKSPEADAGQHTLEFFQRYSRLVLFESQFIVDQPYASQDFQNWIHSGAGPGHDQRPARPQNSVRFAEHTGWLSQVFQDRKHGYMIELRASHRQARSNIRMHD